MYWNHGIFTIIVTHNQYSSTFQVIEHIKIIAKNTLIYILFVSVFTQHSFIVTKNTYNWILSTNLYNHVGVCANKWLLVCVNLHINIQSYHRNSSKRCALKWDNEHHSYYDKSRDWCLREMFAFKARAWVAVLLIVCTHTALKFVYHE